MAEQEILDVSTTEKMECLKDAFRTTIKKLTVLDKLGVEWVPYRKSYTGRWNTYNMEVLLPKENCVLFARVKLPQFDDGQVKYIEQGLATLDDKERHHMVTMTHLFNVVKGRVERGDGVWQDWEYAKAHGEDTYRPRKHAKTGRRWWRR